MIKTKEVIHELLGYPRLKIIQNPEMFCFSIDALLIADFATIHPRVKTIVDLGCGNAPIPLFLTLKTKAQIMGIELQTAIAGMAKRSVELNQLSSQISIFERDINTLQKNDFNHAIDIVISNPPYFKIDKASNLNKNEYLTIARHEVMITLNDIARVSSEILSHNGLLYLVHRAERIDEIILSLKNHHFLIKRLRFVHSKENENAQLVLIEAKKNANPGLKIMKPLYLYDKYGSFSDELQKIFHFGQKK